MREEDQGSCSRSLMYSSASSAALRNLGVFAGSAQYCTCREPEFP